MTSDRNFLSPPTENECTMSISTLILYFSVLSGYFVNVLLFCHSYVHVYCEVAVKGKLWTAAARVDGGGSRSADELMRRQTGTDEGRWRSQLGIQSGPESPAQTPPDLNITPLMLILIYCLLKSNASSSHAVAPRVQCLTLHVLHHVHSTLQAGQR